MLENAMNRPEPTLSTSPWRALSWEDLADTRLVPTMLSPEERRAYIWLTENLYSGRGALVELGCFAGGSTAAMAEGLRRSGKQARIQAFDRFKVSEMHKRRFLYSAGILPFSGDDLLPVAERFMAPWRDLVDLHRTELSTHVWPGDPIEMLVMDASKTTKSMDAMAASFFPALLPQAGLIVQQDFLHWKTPWVAVQMARLGSAVTPVAHVAPDTVVFRVERAILPSDIAAAACSPLDDVAMKAGLHTAELMMQGFDVGPKLALLDQALERNAGVRQAKFMANPPG